MRFGLSDLDELPSLKEFEQLARAALGSDEGIAPVEVEPESANESAIQSIPDSAETLAAAEPAPSPAPETIEAPEVPAQEAQAADESQSEPNPGNALAESAS